MISFGLPHLLCVVLFFARFFFSVTTGAASSGSFSEEGSEASIVFGFSSVFQVSFVAFSSV